MAYEHEHLTGRSPAENYRRYEDASYTPWLVLLAVVVGLVALIWVFGGAPANDPGLAPRMDSSLVPEAAPGAAPAVIPGAETGAAPAPAAPVAID